jgi:hypothetical protein
MTHPAVSCPVAAQLWRAVCEASKLHSASEPEVMRLAEIREERRQRDWQEAWDAYTQHVSGCQVCQAAVKVVPDGMMEY